MAHRDGDAAEVLGGQTTFIGQRAHDGSGAHVLALADVQPVRLKVPVRSARAAVTVAASALTATATPVAFEAVALATVLLGYRTLLEQEVRPAL